MNIPMSWLKEYVDIDCDTKTFEEAMTMSGSKVETTEYVGFDIENVVVGKIISIEKHPDADKLVVTKIDIGKDEPIQIVTGAKNININDIVPVALNNSTIAKGIKIKKGKLRGQVSEGMLCSIEELGYTKHDYPEVFIYFKMTNN
jgi:phenylalanyl-tRNA synthetase beta chain